MQSKSISFAALMCLFLIVNCIMACSTVRKSRPNTSTLGPYPKGFEIIIKNNKLLAKEIGKIPELQDGISEKDSEILEQLCDLYSKDSKNFNTAFDQMYQIGIPEARKYCSPLQAIFWLFEDGKNDDLEDIIENYDLNKLLTKSWGPQNSYDDLLNLPAEDAILIAKKYVKDIELGHMQQSRKKSYAVSVDMYLEETSPTEKSKILQDIKNWIHIDYIIDPNRFELEGRKILSNVLEPKDNYNRWNDFEVVTSRINDPLLLHYYIQHNFRYKWDHKNRHCQHPKTTFELKNGCCVCIASFGAYCLDKSGYNTSIRHLYCNISDQHGVLITKNEYEYFIVVDFSQSLNRMYGPFYSLLEVDRKITKGLNCNVVEKKFIRKKFGFL